MWQRGVAAEEGAAVKENVYRGGGVGVGARWAWAALAASGAALLLAAAADRRLPPPLPRAAPPSAFSGERAHDHLVNLTSIGPRVAGTYEAEVAAVRVLVAALRDIAAAASPHNAVDVDVFSASGAFTLTFLDGMTNVYRDVQSVVARARGLPSRPNTPALLLNCHYDTVPDSPGASDDGAGCAVALEVFRALAARPLRYSVLLLLNGAEENIMQGSHAFVTTHAWAPAARAFINIEACGAGGREVLFQAGPGAGPLLAYVRAAPHPFGSSLAQELFRSGLLPADTDFRVFRDHGGLSGLDLAWHADGYVYHTRLDTHQRVSPAVLQRTGDNVLAVATALLEEGWPTEAEEKEFGKVSEEGAPVFFDVLGWAAVACGARAALLLAGGALLLVLLVLRRSAAAARRHLYLDARQWARSVGAAALCLALAWAAGLAAALLPALLLAAARPLAFYCRPWLLLPLYSAPALAGAWADARLTWWGWGGRAARARGVRGWWGWRAWRDATALAAAAALAAAVAARARSGFVAALWTLPAAAGLLPAAGGRAAAAHAAAAALPAAATAALALPALDTLVPLTGRAGTAPLPPDVMVALTVAAWSLLVTSWMLPLVVMAHRPNSLMWALVALCAAGTALALAGAPYSAERPQRLMVYHTRRTAHGHVGPAVVLGAPPAPHLAAFTAEGPAPALPSTDTFYWIPELDANTPHSLDRYVEGMSEAVATSAEECARWVYCGAPYSLPALRLVRRGHRLRAPPAPPPAHLALAARLTPPAPAAGSEWERELELVVWGGTHVVVILAGAEGVRVTACWPPGGPLQEGPAWGARRTHFVQLFAARGPRAEPWRLRCRLAGRAPPPGAPWLSLSAAAHALGAPRAAPHAALLAALPDWVAPTGWAVDLHLLDL